MLRRGLIVSFFFSAVLFLGACASNSADVAATDTAATTDTAAAATHECPSGQCTHDAGHQCTEACKHDKNHKCSADCKSGKSCDKHAEHTHKHSKTCGHKTVKHGDHVDYIHDGHQHFNHGDHVDEHKSKKAEAPATSTNS